MVVVLKDETGDGTATKTQAQLLGNNVIIRYQ